MVEAAGRLDLDQGSGTISLPLRMPRAAIAAFALNLAQAAELEGFKFDDKVKLGNADLVLNGHPLRVIGTHLDLSGLWRRRQIRALLARLDGAAHHLPTVLMGDFNQWSDRGALSEFAFHHHRLVKTPPSFHSNRPVARLDRIIVSHDIMVESSGAHQSDLSKRASDHLPLWATLKYA